jgi:nucleoside 2-deoxyribosyltransferase
MLFDHMKLFVVHSSSSDFKNKLYTPLRQSELNTEHEIHLPHENGKEQITKELIRSCDAVIAEVSLPSTGEGIELGWASAFNVPVICISEKGAKVSNSLRFITSIFVEYSNSEEMIAKLKETIAGLA